MSNKKNGPKLNSAFEISYLVCADPDSRQIYTLDPKSGQVVIEQGVDEGYRRSAIHAIEDVKYILGTDEKAVN